MIYVAWVLSLIFVALVAYHYRKVVDTLRSIKITQAPVKTEEAKSVVLDPDDVVQQAQHQHEQNMKKLNPDL